MRQRVVVESPVRGFWVGLPIIAALLALFVSACTPPVAPAGGGRPMMGPQIAQMGKAAFEDVVARTPVSTDLAAREFVTCTGAALASVLDGDPGRWSWQFELFAADSAGAFALPGGRVGVDEGLLIHVRRQDQLAAVIAHGMAHLAAGHAEQRVAAALGDAVGDATPGASLADAAQAGDDRRELALAALGYGDRIGEILPYTLEQEAEADSLSLVLMSQAGFDPRESVEPWKSLRRAGGAAAQDFPEYFEAHTVNDGRIKRLYADIGSSVSRYRDARALGRRPDCPRPR